MSRWLKLAQTAYDDRNAQQVPAELANVLAFLKPRNPRRVLEIGIHDAGALWAWGQLVPRDGQVFGVDKTSEHVREANITDLAPRDARVFVGDSLDHTIFDQVRDALTGPIDFLFIDGDHTRERVLADFQAWRRLVAPAGIVGFHDTRVAAREGWLDALDTVGDATTVEFVKRDDNDMRCGIGLVILGP